MSSSLQVPLGNLVVRFIYEDWQAERSLGLLFNDWPYSSTHPAAASAGLSSDQPLIFAIQVVDRLDDLAANSRLIFSEQNEATPTYGGLTSVYENASGHVISFGHDAIAQVPSEIGDATQDKWVRAQVARHALGSGRLEDVVFCCLAPLLRRRGFYLIHAFAVVKDGRGLLLVGESGSGKTTTGLSLLAQGWRYLANDVALLKEDGGNVQVWPTPGGISLTRESFALLPHLPQPNEAGAGFAGKRFYPATKLVGGWAAAADAKFILFPEVGDFTSIGLQRRSRSVALARMMEGSIDRWDLPCLDNHLRLLERLSRQTEAYDVRLGKDLGQLPHALSQIC